MKKLSFILFLSFALIGHANAHSGRTDSNGGHNDYSNGTYHYHNSGNNNSSGMNNDPCGLMNIFDYNENQPGYTPCIGIYAYEANYELGTAFMGIFQAVAEGNANENTSKAKYNTQPTNFYLNKNDAKRGKYNAKYYQKIYDAKTGKYNLSNSTKSINAYNPLICIKGYIKTSDGCKKISNQTPSPSPISNFKTKKQYILGFSDFSDLLGFLLGLTFIGILYWWIFKDLTLNIFSAIKKFIARFINKN